MSDALELLQKIRYDLTAAQAKITDLQRMIATLDLPVRQWIPCPELHCGIRCHDARAVAEHLYIVHDGPKPVHFYEPPGNPIAPSTSDSGSILPAE